MVNLNLLTAKKGDAALNPIDVTEIEFWEYYLKLLNVTQSSNKQLNDKEVNIMSYILAGNPHRSYFRGSEGEEIKTHFRINKSGLSKLKTNLERKGYIENTGAARGDALPTRAIRKFQMYVKKAYELGSLPVLNFAFTFNIDERTTEQDNQLPQEQEDTTLDRGLYSSNDGDGIQ